MALARLSLLKSAALLNDTGTSNDVLYKALLASASKAVQRYCGRLLESATYTSELYSGNGTDRLYLREWPVTALTSVSIWDGTAWTAEAATEYELCEGMYIKYPKTGREGTATYSCWPDDAVDNIKITYTAGYATTSWDTADLTAAFGVPEDLELAVALLTKWHRRHPLGVASETMGPRGITYLTNEAIQGVASGLPPEVVGLLGPYKAVRFA